MSWHEYEVSRVITAQDLPFYALVMAAMRQADTDNQKVLQEAFPDVWAELRLRYDAPGGILEDD